MKKVALIVLVAALSCGVFAFPALAEDEFEKPNYTGSGKGDAMLFDLILLRPLGLASVGFGFAGTIVAFPFSVIANNSREVGEAMLGETLNYTFVRPLGDVFQPPTMLDR